MSTPTVLNDMDAARAGLHQIVAELGHLQNPMDDDMGVCTNFKAEPEEGENNRCIISELLHRDGVDIEGAIAISDMRFELQERGITFSNEVLNYLADVQATADDRYHAWGDNEFLLPAINEPWVTQD